MRVVIASTRPSAKLRGRRVAIGGAVGVFGLSMKSREFPWFIVLTGGRWFGTIRAVVRQPMTYIGWQEQCSKSRRHVQPEFRYV